MYGDIVIFSVCLAVFATLGAAAGAKIDKERGLVWGACFGVVALLLVAAMLWQSLLLFVGYAMQGWPEGAGSP